MSLLRRTTLMPARGMGMLPPRSPVVEESKQENEEVRVCIDKSLRNEMISLSAELAVAENCDNLPLVPFGAADAFHPFGMALITGKKWQNGRTINCYFMGGLDSVKQKIIKFAKQWEQFANIKLNFIDNRDASDVRIGFDVNDGSWSYIGTDCLSMPKTTMNFGWLEANTPDEEYSRVVIHEFGHMLGCIHEHQHPEAGIPWDTAAVYKYYMGPPNNWTKEDVDINLFQKYSTSITQYSIWDTLSIMCYAIPKAFTGGKLEVGWNTSLSNTDKSFMSKMYPFPKANQEELYITKLFKLIFDREPGEHELPIWTNKLKSNGRSFVVISLEQNPESLADLGTSLYKKAFGIVPEAGKLNEITSLLRSKVTEEQVLARLLASDEYKLAQANNDKQVMMAVYRTLLNREITSVESAIYNYNVDNRGKYQTILSLISSSEYRSVVINGYYERILRRSASLQELNSWAALNVDFARVRYSLEGSQEFFNLIIK
jgi:serralysin